MNSLIVFKKPKSPMSESYRTLRTNIEYSSLDLDLKIIAITSAGPEEGKTTTACNLALVIAQYGKKVLLIDSDMRRPSIHKIFNLLNNVGLSNLLMEGLKIEDVAFKAVPNLHVLTAGTIPPNPSEVLASHKMSNFLKAMEETYDTIILDTPPVIAFTDAQILATKSEGVLIVVSQSEATISGVVKAKELLNAVKANIIGVVLNKVDPKSGNGYGYYNYYYCGHDEKRAGRKKRR